MTCRSRSKRAKRYIRAGDIYQVNLAHRIEAACGAGGWELYERLLRATPAPFSAYFAFDDFAMVSSSPELFLKMSCERILTRPIKGTRPRGENVLRDAELADELRSSEKENAELVMITDLLRNDLGRVCQYGTIRVPELMRLERYSQAIATDAVEGDCISELLRKRAAGFFEVADVKPWLAQLCQTLDDAHKIQLVHGDLSLDHFFVDKRGRLVVANFGIGRCVRDAVWHAAGPNGGTPPVENLFKSVNFKSNRSLK